MSRQAGPGFAVATAKVLEDQQAAMNEQVGFFRFDDAPLDATAAEIAGRR
jgi:hypothetical protein